MAQRPEELVELLPAAEPFLEREAAVSEPAQRRGLVLVHDLAGEFDAGHSSALAGAHLLAALQQPTRLGVVVLVVGEHAGPVQGFRPHSRVDLARRVASGARRNHPRDTCVGDGFLAAPAGTVAA